MRDTELYEGLLGLTPPWKVETVELDTGNKSVEVTVGYQEGTLWGNQEGRRLPVYDHGSPVERLVKIKAEVVDYLQEVLDNIAMYLANKEYLAVAPAVETPALAVPVA